MEYKKHRAVIAVILASLIIAELMFLFANNINLILRMIGLIVGVITIVSYLFIYTEIKK